MRINGIFRPALTLSLLLNMPLWADDTPAADAGQDLYRELGYNSSRAYDGHDEMLVDAFSGTLQLHYQDLTLSGTGPDLTVHRIYNSADTSRGRNNYAGEYWSIHYGYLTNRFSCQNGEVWVPPGTAFIREDGKSEVIQNRLDIYADSNGNGQYDEDIDYKPEYMTTDFSRIDCQGELLRMTRPNGMQYFFGDGDVEYRVVKVEDPHGNYYAIDYLGDSLFDIRPSTVTSSDGRKLVFAYESGVLKSVTGGTKKVEYVLESGYAGIKVLTDVKQPEGFTWTYEYNSNAEFRNQVKSIESPLGSKRTIDYDLNYFLSYEYPVVSEKCIDGVCWTYNYTWQDEEGEPEHDKTTITGPDGVKEYLHYGLKSAGFQNVWRVGLMVQMTHRYQGNVIYQENNEWYGLTISTNPRSYSQGSFTFSDLIYRVPRLDARTVKQDDRTMSYRVLERDTGANPSLVEEKGSKTLRTRYEYVYMMNENGPWFLNLPSKMSIGFDGEPLKRVSQTTYTPRGQIDTALDQGSLRRYTYYSNGTLKTEADGVDNTIEHSNYFRGVPRRTDYPDNSYVTREVDSFGRVKSERNRNGRTTFYDFDNLDRVTEVRFPVGDKATVDYMGFGRKEVFTRGDFEQTRFYNERKLLVELQAKDIKRDETFTTIYRYDPLDRLKFTSYVNDPDKGLTYFYDGLDRVVETRRADGRAVKKQYIHAAKTISIDEENHETVYEYDTISHSNKHLAKISAPEGVVIDMTRNELGQLLTVTQDNITREYDYNSFWLLNFYREPEKAGHLEFGYDNALRKSSQFHVLATGNLETTFDYDVNGRLDTVTRPSFVRYNGDYRSSIPSVTDCVGFCRYQIYTDVLKYGYDNEGNTKSVTKTRQERDITFQDNDFTESESQRDYVWSYDYEPDNLLKKETLRFDNQEFVLEYGYNSARHLSSTTYPTDYSVDYAPDAFGRARKVGTLVNDVQYFDNGVLKQMAYANGHVTRYTLDEQLRPETLKMGDGFNDLISLKYDYDLKGNLEYITDYVMPEQSLSMDYDALSRLISANGSWGLGYYNYDVLGNIKDKTVGDLTKDYTYNNYNQLETFDGKTFTYDFAGRVIDDERNQYFYDFGSNVIWAKDIADNIETEIEYDGYDRMVQRQSEGEKSQFVYSTGGKLVFEQSRSGDNKRNHIYLGNKLVAYHDTQVECDLDLDGDGLPHCYERDNGLDPNDSRDASEDADGDGLSNLEEYQSGTDLNSADTDGDGLPDGYEVSQGLDALNADADGDADSDGFTNLEEFQNGTDPNSFDALEPPSYVSASALDDGVLVNWLASPYAKSYDLFWSLTPFSDVSSATRIDNVSAPFAHTGFASEQRIYYRLVANSQRNASEPSEEFSAYVGPKDWAFQSFEEARALQGLGTTPAGDVFLLDNNYASQPVTVKVKTAAESVSTAYELTNATNTEQFLAVSDNGVAVVSWYDLDRNQIMAATYDPRTREWTRKLLRRVRLSPKEFVLKATANGRFAITWQEARSGYQPESFLATYSEASGWATTEIENPAGIFANARMSGAEALSINQNGDVATLVTLTLGNEPFLHLVRMDGDTDNMEWTEIGGRADRFRRHVDLTDSGKGAVFWIDYDSRSPYYASFSMDEPTVEVELAPLGSLNSSFNEIRLLDDGSSLVMYETGSLHYTVRSVDGDWTTAVDLDINGDVASYRQRDGSVLLFIGFNGYTVFRYSGAEGMVEQQALMGAPTVRYLSNATQTGQFARAQKGRLLEEWSIFTYRADEPQPTNVPPIAEAGLDESMDEDGMILLDAQYSRDPDGTVVGYSWRQISGPRADMYRTETSSPQINAGSVRGNQEMVFEVMAIDDRGATHTDQVTITVIDLDNEEPVARAGADQRVTEGDTVVLDARSSYDPENEALTFNWQVVSGDDLSFYQVTQPGVLQFTAPDVNGEQVYVLEVTVTDTSGLSSTDQVTVTVVDAPTVEAPNADAGADQVVSEGDTVILDARGSSNPQGGSLSLSWRTVSGGNVSLQQGSQPGTLQFIAPDVTADKEFIFEVTVTNADGLSDTDQVSVTVQDVPVVDETPNADAGADQVVNEGDTVVLDARGSSNPQGGSLSLNWRIVSGGSLSLQQGSVPGTLQFVAPDVDVDTAYVLEVTVTNSEGYSDTDQVTITVKDIPANQQSPVAIAGNDQTVAEGDNVTFDARNSYDPDGNSLSYEWAVVSGGNLSLSSSIPGVVELTAPEVSDDQIFVLQVTVTDADGLSSSDEVRLTVTDSGDTDGNQAPVADAGADQTVNEGELVILDATGSYDPDGAGLSLSWSVVSGGFVNLEQGPQPGMLQFVAPNVPVDTVIELEVTVTDTLGASSSDRILVTVLNTSAPPPSAVCEIDFNNDGIVDDKDFYTPNYEGIYWAVNIYVNYNAYYASYFPDTPVEKLDWNKDGNITIEEISQGMISPDTLDTFHTQFWYYMNQRDAYYQYYPDSGCQ